MIPNLPDSDTPSANKTKPLNLLVYSVTVTRNDFHASPLQLSSKMTRLLLALLRCFSFFFLQARLRVRESLASFLIQAPQFPPSPYSQVSTTSFVVGPRPVSAESAHYLAASFSQRSEAESSRPMDVSSSLKFNCIKPDGDVMLAPVAIENIS